MFREEYIKDNEMIKPDDDFLNRLKKSVMQEDEVVHIGDYVDYDDTNSFEKIGENDEAVVVTSSLIKRNLGWKSLVSIAACFVLVCTIAFAIGQSGTVGKEGIRADMESVLSETTDTSKDAKVDINQEYSEVYNQVCDLFSMNNVRIYEIDSYEQEAGGIEYLQEKKQQYRQLDIKERDGLVGNIIANQYTLVNTTQNLENPIYYIAEFENQSCVVFTIDSNQCIYIIEVSGIQDMA